MIIGSIFSMCNYNWFEVICFCNKGKNCCMNYKWKVIVSDCYRYFMGRQIFVKDSGQRCQYWRRNVKGGWVDFRCKYSEKKEVVGYQLSEMLCLWCLMDCEWVFVDD